MLDGIDGGRVSAWLDEAIEDLRPPLRYSLIAGGHSNLTYHVTDAVGQQWVLRRPPLGDLLPKAHDMERESRIQTALASTPIPVPEVVAFCADEDVTGAPFYVMRHVEGLVIRDEETAARLDPRQRHALGLEVVDTLAAIHAVDPHDVGLDDLGRPTGYIQRQLRRWHSQLEQSRTRELPVLEEVHRKLTERTPPDSPGAVVHGDYRLDNCIVGAGGALEAVLDWELSTLGDPMADLGLLLVYWSQPGDAVRPLEGAPTALPGFPSRREVIERYEAASGRDCSRVAYYVAFGYWKLACISEGVHRRYLQGAMGDRDGTAQATFERSVLELGDAAMETLHGS